MTSRWKSYKLFDTVENDVTLPNNVTACVACDRSTSEGADELDRYIWLGTDEGLLTCLYGTPMSATATIPAFRGRVLCLNVAAERVVVLGEEARGDARPHLMIKCWEIRSLLSGTNPPAEVAVRVVQPNKLPEGRITVAAVSTEEWPTVHVAVGTSEGCVHVYSGDILKGKMTAPFGKHVMRPRIHEEVTGLHISDGRDVEQRHLFAVSTSSVVALGLSSGQVLLQDNCGAEVGCSAISDKNELILCGPDAFQFYTAAEGRKAALALSGKKSSLAVYKHYIMACVSMEDAESGPVTSLHSRFADKYVGATSPRGNTNLLTQSGTEVHVFDFWNKVIGISVPIPGKQVSWICPTLRGFVFAEERGKVMVVRERSLERRLEALFNARAFNLALKIAESDHAEEKVLASVHRHFGDYLYSKRDYDGATVQYIETIGHLEPSHVIQRLLEPRNAHNLISYLENIHKQGLATADHTTILLTCYAKMKDEKSIENFLDQAEDKASTFHLDAQAAVSALRMAGLSTMVMLAAEHAKDSDPWLYVEVLLYDCAHPQKALEFLKSLGRKKAAEGLRKHGKKLVDMEPITTTALLMELSLPTTPSMAVEDGDGGYVANFSEFTHLFAERPEDLKYACVTILAMGEGEMDATSRKALYHTLLDLYLSHRWKGGKERMASLEKDQEDRSAGGELNEYGRFEDDDRGEASAVGSTVSAKEQAMDLLQRGWPPGGEPAYDVGHAMTICRTHAFADGLVFLYTSQRMFREACAILADAKEWERLLELCDVHGMAAAGGDPEIWRDALERLSSVAAGPTAIGPLEQLISRIETKELFPPLVVLPILARNPHLKFSLIRDYIARAMMAENRAVSAANDEIERLQKEIDSSEKKIHRLKTEPVVFQASRDAQTGAPLELPSVHFLCGHSFNLRTLSDGADERDVECSLCQAEHRRLRDVQRSHSAAAADPDTFYKQLKSASDGFEVVAEYFGKGLLNASRGSMREREIQF